MSGDLKQLACDYFLLLSGIEYALKNSGYVKADSENNAQPDWNKFKEQVYAKMKVDTDDSDIAAIRKQRPTRQIYMDNKISWSIPQEIGQTDNKALIDACLTIRNNLFHGAKNNDGNAERNAVLIMAATKILNAALDADQTLKSKYQEAVL